MLRRDLIKSALGWFVIFRPLTAGAQASRSLAAHPEANALRLAGWDAAYRTDYRLAKEKFANLQRRLPEHPVGDLSMASIVWQEYLFRTRRLQSNVFKRDSAFYAGAKDSKEGADGDAVDPQVEQSFESHLDHAMAKAQAWVDASPDDVEANYFLGSVYGIRAAYEASAQRKFWAAIRDGLRSVKLHRRVVRLNPAFYDAYLTMGTYHYAVGSIPQPFRAIAVMAGVRGSKTKGIAELELVLRKGTYNREDARALLIALYRYEGTPQKALTELEAFIAKYPENVLLRVEMGSTLAQMRRGAEAAATFEALLQEPGHRVLDLVHFQYGEALASARAYLKAAEHFAAAERVVDADEALVTQGLMRAGQMNDLAGHRSEAVKFYRACLSRPAPEEFRHDVQRWLEQPFTVK